MEQIDIKEILRLNPQLNQQEIEALLKTLEEINSGQKGHYRLAPTGTHRASTSVPYAESGDIVHARGRSRRF